MGFIDSQRELGHAVESICRVLTEQGCRIAARTYRAWKKASAPTMADIEVAHVVNAILDVIWIVDAEGRRRLAPEGLYGRRKLTALLRRQDHDVNGYVVDKAMRLLGHAGIRRGRQVRTTIPGKDGRRAGDLLNRDFTAAAPNRVWVADFTYCRTWAGFSYTAFVVDVFADRIVSWHVQITKHTELVTIPLRMALWSRDREAHPVADGLVAHSDAGSQYTSVRYTDHLMLEGLSASIGSVGDAYDNALMESIIGLYKTECIGTTVFHDGPYKTVADVEYATAGWVDWYNHRRLHSRLGYTTPVEFEHAHYTALALEGRPR